MTAAPNEEAKVLRFGIRTPSQLKRRYTEAGGMQYVIDGLIPRQALALVVGDSGLGKSPLLYQAATCVAEGVPFLGHSVNQGRVLYLDCENGVGQVDGIVSQVSRHLGCNVAPEGLLLWNLNDCNEKYTLDSLIQEAKPSLVVVDPLKAVFPDLEREPKNTIAAYQQIRHIMATHHCSLVGVHHVRKPGETPLALDKGSVQPWFLQARGTRELINGCDVRIGVDRCSLAVNGDTLVMRGFSRVEGEIPLQRLLRVLDEDGEPQGFRHLCGVDLLHPSDQQDAFGRLPAWFRFREALVAYGKGDQATSDFLKKCMGVGILRKVERGVYEKIHDSKPGEPIKAAA